MFDLVNFALYRKDIIYHKNLNVNDNRFTLGRVIKNWAQKVHSKGFRPKEPFSSTKPCPKGSLLPSAVNLKQAYCIASVPDPNLPPKKILLVVPYLEQQILYRKIKLTQPYWADLQISTANNQGAEDDFICYDGTAAANMGGNTKKPKDPAPVQEQSIVDNDDHEQPVESDLTHDVQYLERIFQYFRDGQLDDSSGRYLGTGRFEEGGSDHNWRAEGAEGSSDRTCLVGLGRVEEGFDRTRLVGLGGVEDDFAVAGVIAPGVAASALEWSVAFAPVEPSNL
ncbi:hypothetical protein BKA64DRAFT_726218 [Cadophora sp. MPI-SDFR-AT-0126]|nr:hypothetical protein BKA64DRAFT_726218 [Leotiomycetes sp. MPI-SDFR-AT-0126]